MREFSAKVILLKKIITTNPRYPKQFDFYPVYVSLYFGTTIMGRT